MSIAYFWHESVLRKFGGHSPHTLRFPRTKKMGLLCSPEVEGSYGKLTLRIKLKIRAAFK
jgi:hypothetical protein